MDLTYSTEQILLRDSLRRFLKERQDFAKRRAAGTIGVLDRDLWKGLAELGIAGLPFALDDEAAIGGPVEVSIVAEELGRALVTEPWLGAVVLAGGVVARLGTAEQRSQLLGPLARGERLLAFAHTEREAGDDLRFVGATVQPASAGYTLSGLKCLVLGGADADVFLVSARSGKGEGGVRVYVVPAHAPGVSVTPVVMVDGSRSADVRLENVSLPADAVLGTEADASAEIAAAIDAAIAALASDAVGAMDALTEATAAYTQQRVQFGRPLSALQALRHRMAEMAIKCQEARAIALLATLSVRSDDVHRVLGVAAAKTKIANLSRHVAQEAVQLHGAIGFTEELIVGAYFKRLYAFENLLGSTTYHLRRYAGQNAAMDLDLSPEEHGFRQEVRHFLKENLTDELKRAERLNTGFLAEPSVGRRWQAIVHKRGWAAPSWPKEYGGPGWSLTQRYIFDQECESAGEPHFRSAGIKMLGPVLMKYGSDEQKAAYLPRILSGEDLWAQGYSEPGSGSDLASLTTSATRDGDVYVVNGSKIWTTLGHAANRMFALVRTDKAERKQEGITFLLIDLTSPGISIRPITSLCGSHEFNQVFFDNVRAPVENRVGAQGQGWEIAKYLLEFERGGSFAGAQLRKFHSRLVVLANAEGPGGVRPIDDPLVAARIAEIGMDIDANDILELRTLSQVRSGQNPGQVPAATMKVLRSRIRQSISQLAASILGQDALRWNGHRPLFELPNDDELLEERAVASALYFNSRSQSIFGGSNEIQLEIIAKALLG